MEGGQLLHRDEAVEIGLAGEVDRPHAAAPELREQGVAPDHAGAVSHGCAPGIVSSGTGAYEPYRGRRAQVPVDRAVAGRERPALGDALEHDVVLPGPCGPCQRTARTCRKIGPLREHARNGNGTIFAAVWFGG